MNKCLSSIDYKTLLNLLLEEKDYEELVMIGKGNLLDIPIYKKNDEILKNSFDKAIASGVKGDFWEQNENARTFRHMAINRRFNDGNHLRLYLCPQEEYLYKIVNELFKRCNRTGEPIYLKYSRENRFDKIVMFLKNEEDLKSKIRLLNEIKKENPHWFYDMKKADSWLSKSLFEGAFIAPEKFVKRDSDIEFKSYTNAFQSLMINVKNELLFHFKTLDFNKLKNMSIEELMEPFQYYFNRELGKMGLFLFYDQENNLLVYTNSLFPGFGKSVDEDINLTKEGLEVGKRIDQNHKEYFKIPFGENIPITSDEYKRFDSYVMDDRTAYIKKFYPQLYQEELKENSNSSVGVK